MEHEVNKADIIDSRLDVLQGLRTGTATEKDKIT